MSERHERCVCCCWAWQRECSIIESSIDTNGAHAISKFSINEFRHQDVIGPSCEHQLSLTGRAFSSYRCAAHYDVVSCVGKVCELFPNPLSFSIPLRIIPTLPLPALSNRPISIRPSSGQSMQTAVRWGLRRVKEGWGEERMRQDQRHSPNTTD